MGLKLIECPRDAMQGISTFIDTAKKTAYINQLLKVGFDTVDFGSFVSPKAIPQMRDTAEVLDGLDLSATRSKLLAIIGNKRGAEDACKFEQISYLGYPFSISETFQQRNTNAGIEESLGRVEEIQKLCTNHKKTLVLYISMAFGNPYGDQWGPELVTSWSQRLAEEFGIKIIALSDTIGVADADTITLLFSQVIPALKNVEIGAHLHAIPGEVSQKIAAAYHAGCRRFDGALKGFGGCPMAKDELTGNMNSELMIEWLQSNGIETGVDMKELDKALELAGMVFA